MLETISNDAVAAGLGIVSGGVMGAASGLLDTVQHIAKANFDRALKMGDAVDATMDKASNRGSKAMRGVLLGLAVAGFVVAWVAGFLEVPIQLEQEVTKGILFWKKTVVELVQTSGIVVFKEIRQILIYSLTFSMGYIAMKGRS